MMVPFVFVWFRDRSFGQGGLVIQMFFWCGIRREIKMSVLVQIPQVAKQKGKKAKKKK